MSCDHLVDIQFTFLEFTYSQSDTATCLFVFFFWRFMYLLPIQQCSFPMNKMLPSLKYTLNKNYNRICFRYASLTKKK